MIDVSLVSWDPIDFACIVWSVSLITFCEMFEMLSQWFICHVFSIFLITFVYFYIFIVSYGQMIHWLYWKVLMTYLFDGLGVFEVLSSQSETIRNSPFYNTSLSLNIFEQKKSEMSA